MSESANDKHQRVMKKLKAGVDQAIADARDERSVVVLLTGDGKGKSSSAFGMVMRALGYGQRVAVVQFIKGQQLSGEEIYLRTQHPELPFYQMGTGFTWDTQNPDSDIAAAERTWAVALEHLQNPELDLLVLDELTYMLGFRYLDEQLVLNAIRDRRPQLSVVVTGRGGGSALRELADTVAEIQDVKHAFRNGVMARKGVDY
ncbi:cob(I)yrinic acid a,c-diamide adenosyltransferase [Permianibacter aggregans]|uniref:Corrinoid adenosyltransferase n=1 Tax=Permianibacter aggregans TaxID=1510150 RepID=A0A4R6UYG6_9GAMM|nr:cob(I)yrinic acid a,c-diamide adenosyltransferase [Permianibacter aggregans]QGX41553.1 cob(I)yrinic acid a,c-diamide adenosyltransferase [Permianibacter aggregans]TDQ51356.1 cob(I)alamin adenosyltransferase [Permianibacter aggregans]